MLTPFKLGVGGAIGSGRQYISWIALDDAVRVIQLAAARGSTRGTGQRSCSAPVTNRQFTESLGRILGRPTVLPMPAFAARLAFGEMADEMLLSGVRAAPCVENAGFAFQYRLEPALRHILERTNVA